MSGERIIRLHHEGVCYTPVVRVGQILDHDAVAALAAVPGEPRPPRGFLGVACDESVPRIAGKPPLALRPGCVTDEPIPLWLGDSAVEIGMVTLVLVPPETVPDTVGPALLATARLHDSRLAEIVWRALQTGILDGLCAIVLGVEQAGRLVVAEITAVQLGARETSSLETACVVQTWEGDSDAALLAELDL